MALVGGPTYSWCPGESWASPRNVPTLAIGWAEGLGCLPPPLLLLSALRVLLGPLIRGCPLLRLAKGYMSLGLCIWCHLLLCLAFQYSIPACWQLPMSTGVPPWFPGGPYHVSGPSLRSESGVQFGSWAAEWPQQPPFGPLSAWWYLPCFHRWLLIEDRMSLVTFFICLGPQGGRLGSL